MYKIKFTILILALLSLIFVLISFFSNKATIYSPKKNWTYLISNNFNKNIDTLNLEILDSYHSNFQREIEWKYSNQLDSSSLIRTIINERTGVVDFNSNYIISLFYKSRIWIHPPRNSYLKYSELVHFPYIEFPITIGNSHNWDLTPSGKDWGEIENLKVQGNIKVISKIIDNKSMIGDSCWLLQATGITKNQKYYAKYYYNEKYGFVYFNYQFNERQFEIKLINIIDFQKKD